MPRVRADSGFSLTTGDANYLRLDCANDPLTSDLEINGNLGVGVTPLYPSHILAAVDDVKTVYINGATNDFTTSATTCINLQLERDVNINTGTLANYAGIQNALSIKHTDAAMSGVKYNYGIINKVINTGTVSYAGAIIGQNEEIGEYTQINNDATYDAESTGVFFHLVRGNYIEMDYDAEWTDSGGVSGQHSIAIEGIFIDIDSDPTLTSGTIAIQNNGHRIRVQGTTVGTGSVARGIFIENVQGCDSNWGIYDTSGANWALDSDSQKIYFGENTDSYLEFDGNSLNIVANNTTATDTISLTGNVVINTIKTGATQGAAGAAAGEVWALSTTNALMIGV